MLGSSQPSPGHEAGRHPIAAKFVVAAAENGRTGPATLAVAGPMGDDFEQVKAEVAAGIQASNASSSTATAWWSACATPTTP
ncbi:hypothetical protein OHA72_51125 [Dactylosporangium sp. NBC_01737]|uniref:hypothetical protein n=1 Tax=Dactylosporangium sp. NBC_01737 TaxID=2975959 RepID=UPI002E1502D7|nr:hypothetical protein OHA72_51125 [Dactylosporangium sp. NBC_01737]